MQVLPSRKHARKLAGQSICMCAKLESYMCAVFVTRWQMLQDAAVVITQGASHRSYKGLKYNLFPCPMSCSSEARLECINRSVNSTLVGGNFDLSPHAARRPVASLQRLWLMLCAALACCWQWCSSGQSTHQKTHAIRADSPDFRLQISQNIE